MNFLSRDLLVQGHRSPTLVLLEPKYRPEIDGLRGLAVLAVIAYHAFPNLMPRGFIGVDVFFVISGYVITGSLWSAPPGRHPSLISFYERRLRRVAPALLAMLMAAGIAAAFLLLPRDLTTFSYSVLATLGTAANLWFWGEGDYFFTAGAEQPLLHAWSLGVEEQFYVFFPMLIMLVWRRSVLALGVIGALTLGSFALNVFALSVGADVPAFYLLPTRAWEIGAGAVVFLASTPLPAALGWLGLALLGLACSRVTPDILPAGLPAVVGAVLVIASRGPPVLSYRPLVFVGLISYSLYLWHWPMLAFPRYRAVEPIGTLATCGILTLVFLIAAASWRWVEQPLRERSFAFSRVAALCGTAALALLVGAVALLWSGGLPERFPANAVRWNQSQGTHFRCPAWDMILVHDVRGCRLVGDPSKAQVVLLGNSAAQMYAPAVIKVLKEQGESGFAMTFNGCLPVLGANITPLCNQIATRAIFAASRTRAKVVIVGTTWDAPLSGLPATLAFLQSSGKEVILIGPVADPTENVASVAARRAAFGLPIGPLGMERGEFERRYGRAADVYGSQPGVIFMAPARRQCDHHFCPYVSSGQMLFSDGVHLSREGAALFEPDLKAALLRAESP